MKIKKILSNLAGSVVSILSRIRAPNFRKNKNAGKQNNLTPIVFVCPEYDKLTSVMSKWLSSFAVKVKPYLLENNQIANNHEFLRLCRDCERLTLVFFGHGKPDHFKSGAPGNPFLSSTILSQNTEFSSVELNVIAFCCHAGKKLGPELRGLRYGNKFLGYVRAIPFLIDDEISEEVFFRPIMDELTRMFKNGEFIVNTDSLLQNYRIVKKECEYGRYNDHPDSFLFGMFIDHHIRSLDSQV